MVSFDDHSQVFHERVISGKVLLGCIMALGHYHTKYESILLNVVVLYRNIVPDTPSYSTLFLSPSIHLIVVCS